MATTNVIQWNPSSSGTENDATYLTDTTRINGVTNGQICLGQVFNTAIYQVSTFCTAFCNSLVNKGISTNTASLTGMTSSLTNVLTTADVRTGTTVISFSTNPVFDATHYTKFEMTLLGNVTGSTLANLQAGDMVVIMIAQGSSGGFTFVWPSNCVGTSDIGSAANSVSTQLFYVDSTLTARAVSPLMVS